MHRLAILFIPIFSIHLFAADEKPCICTTSVIPVLKIYLTPEELEAYIHQIRLSDTKLRVAKYTVWKKNPEIEKLLNNDEAGTVQSYIYLTMFLHDESPDRNSPKKIAQATKLAQTVCPSYAYWKEYYQAFSRCERGKGYSLPENIALTLEPTMTKIIKYKTMLALLKGEDVTTVPLTPDWQQEAESIQPQVKNGSLQSLIPLIFPSKQKELDCIKKEFAQLCTVENFQQISMNVRNRAQQLAEQQAAMQTMENKLEQTRQQQQSASRELAQFRDIVKRDRAQQLAEQQAALQAMETKLEQTRQQQQLTSQELAQFHEVKKRVIAQLALFETLHTNNRESLMIETIKSELNALSHKESL